MIGYHISSTMGYNYSAMLRNACSGTGWRCCFTMDGPSKDRCRPSVLWMMLLHPVYNCRNDLTTMKSMYSCNCIYNTRPLHCFMYELFSLSLIVGINLLCTSWMLLHQLTYTDCSTQYNTWYLQFSISSFSPACVS